MARQVEEGLLSFEDVEQMAEEAGSEATGALKLIFGLASPVDLILAFLASDEKDTQIAKKKAVGELADLIEGEVGLECGAGASAAELRQNLVRHLLLGELAMALPEAMRQGTLTAIELPEKAVQRDTIKHLCHRWRNRQDLQDAYSAAAAEVEPTTSLDKLDPPTDLIERLETFAGVDVLLLRRASQALLENDRSSVGQRHEIPARPRIIAPVHPQLLRHAPLQFHTLFPVSAVRRPLLANRTHGVRVDLHRLPVTRNHDRLARAAVLLNRVGYGFLQSPFDVLSVL